MNPGFWATLAPECLPGSDPFSTDHKLLLLLLLMVCLKWTTVPSWLLASVHFRNQQVLCPIPTLPLIFLVLINHTIPTIQKCPSQWISSRMSWNSPHKASTWNPHSPLGCPQVCFMMIQRSWVTVYVNAVLTHSRPIICNDYCYPGGVRKL